MSGDRLDCPYGKVLAAVTDAVGQGVDAGLSHIAIAEILRDVANALENGNLSRAPVGIADSRFIDSEAHGALDNGADRKVHLVIGDAGQDRSYATWVHGVHGSLLDAKLKARTLNAMTSAVRRTGAEAASDALRQLFEADPRHPAVGTEAGKIVGFARELLIDPGTVYIVESHELDDGRTLLAGRQPDGPPAVELTRAEGRARAIPDLPAALAERPSAS